MLLNGWFLSILQQHSLNVTYNDSLSQLKVQAGITIQCRSWYLTDIIYSSTYTCNFKRQYCLIFYWSCISLYFFIFRRGSLSARRKKTWILISLNSSMGCVNNFIEKSVTKFRRLTLYEIMSLHFNISVVFLTNSFLLTWIRHLWIIWEFFEYRYFPHIFLRMRIYANTNSLILEHPTYPKPAISLRRSPSASATCIMQKNKTFI